MMRDSSEAVGQFTGLVSALRKSWSVAPFVHQLPGPVSKLLSIPEIDEALDRGAIQRPFLRMARAGRPVPAEGFTRDAQVGHRQTRDVVVSSLVRRLMQNGATMVIDSAERIFPEVSRATTAMTEELGHAVDANIYVTPGQTTGFTAHWDAQDVLLVQFHGSKLWTVSKPVQANVNQGGRAEGRELQPLLEHELKVGEVLYIPRGFVHQGAATGEGSGHVTLSVNTVTTLDVLKQRVAELELRCPAQSAPLRGAPDSEVAAFAASVQELGDALRRHLSQDDDGLEQAQEGPADKISLVGVLAQHSV